MDDQQPFVTRYNYVKTMAAIKVLYADQLHRQTANGKINLGQVLERAVDWEMIEYFANGCRWRINNGIGTGEMVHGTVGNEGDHYDLKGWGRNIVKISKPRVQVSLVKNISKRPEVTT